MALTVKDILELPSGQKMTLLAGAKGLKRNVTSIEILDYEFAPGVESDVESGLEPGSFIITSFLFAKDHPELILPAVEKLNDLGMPALGFKQVIYEELPDEVLAYADKNDFPVFSFAQDVWFENIIFDVMYTVQFDDKVYLSEEKISSMLSGSMKKSEVDIIRKGISLKIRQFVSVAYIAGDPLLDTGRILRSFYLSKGLRAKALMMRYENDLFLIITSAYEDPGRHLLTLGEIRDTLSFSKDTQFFISGVHKASELDNAFRESWQTHLARSAERFLHPKAPAGSDDVYRFDQCGVYRILLPLLPEPGLEDFAVSFLEPLLANDDMKETAFIYAVSGGDIKTVSEALHCHPNTVRYRLARIREMTGEVSATEGEFYMHLRMAAAVYAVRML